ncbi:unnamed protein product, partial [Phytomonas sp. EM1]
MSYYVVERLLDRRVRDEDGTIEYKVHWKGYDDERETWEPRSNLLENCTEAMQDIDQKKIEDTEKCIETWRCETGLAGDLDALVKNRGGSKSRKRSRFVETRTCPKDDVETLSCVLLRYKGDESSASAYQGGSLDMPMATVATGADSSIVLLGELIMTEQTASLLYTRKYTRNLATPRRRRRMEALKYCAPAQHLERVWREKLAVSLMHSCMGCDAITPVKDNFTVSKSSDTTQKERVMAGDLEILGIAPPETTISGYIYAKPATFIPWIGEEEAERLRRESVAGYPALIATSQDLLRPHNEGAVVRYAITEKVPELALERISSEEESNDFSGTRTHGGNEDKTETQRIPLRVISSMPLSVFRIVFPQLLIDYLLEHSVVLQAA